MTRNYYLQIQAQRQGYKAAFIDAALWKVLTKTLGSLLKKDWDERLEDDKLIIERILILIRNVLQVPPMCAGRAGRWPMSACTIRSPARVFYHISHDFITIIH